MTTYFTKNPLGSTSPYDLFDNAQNFDIAVNSITEAIWKDRFGNDRKTYWGMEKQFSAQLLGQEQRFNLFIQNSGYQVIGDYVDGPVTITEYNQLVRYNGELWKLTAATDIPFTTTGNNAASWVVDSVHLVGVGDAALRQNLSSDQDDLGDSLVAVKQPFTGAVPRTQHDKNAERITTLDFGAKGDGATDDTAVFAAIDAAFTGKVVDLLGKTHLVTSIPTGNRYANGYFKVGSATYMAVYTTVPKFGTGRVVSGDGALASLPDNYDIGPNGVVIAIGKDALGKATEVKQAIAIGPGAMSESIKSRDNLALGSDALKNIQSDSADYGPLPGSRMIGLGGNAFRFATTGNRGVAIGRNAAVAVTTAPRITAVGANAVGSFTTIDWTNTIVNYTPVTADGITAFGADTLQYCDANNSAAFGCNAGQNIKKGDSNSFFGAFAGQNLDIDLSNTGKILDLTARTGTYSMSGNTVTVISTGVNAVAGNRVKLLPTTGPAVSPEVTIVTVATVISADQFTFTCPISGSGTGNITIDFVETAATRMVSRWNTLTGALAGQLSTHMQETTGSGYGVAKSFEGTAGAWFGWNSGATMTAGTKASGFGHNSMRFMQDGSNATNITNSTCLGANTRVSGDNQNQIGDGNTTTYVYGTVQNRSDARDKTDIRDTVLGIDFILGLRPVDGRWDMRDDYFEEYEVQVGIDQNTAQPIFETRLRPIPKDGSKKRERLHHWLIAQEVKELCDKLGVEFGGYQDHKVNGGCDVLSLGYDEFIPPTVRAVQQCWERMDAIEARLAKLEGK